MDTRQMNVLVLAYLGDTVYENYVRRYLIGRGLANVNALQQAAVSYVSAKGQATFLKKLLEVDFFSESEKDVIRRARNYKTTSHPKGCDIITYKYATGLEALLGYLTLEHHNERVTEIMESILGGSILC